MKPSEKVYIALGANIGSRRTNLSRAITYLKQTKEIRVNHVSPLYQTEPIGPVQQPDFLNGVIEITTSFSPKKLLKQLLKIEKRVGRKRKEKWGPRLLDLDLLTYGPRVINKPRLRVPHPRYHERRFVLVPFSAIAPAFVHPVLKSQNRTLLRKLTLLGQRVTIAATWNGKRFIPSKIKRKTKSPS